MKLALAGMEHLFQPLEITWKTVTFNDFTQRCKAHGVKDGSFKHKAGILVPLSHIVKDLRRFLQSLL